MKWLDNKILFLTEEDFNNESTNFIDNAIVKADIVVKSINNEIEILKNRW